MARLMSDSGAESSNSGSASNDAPTVSMLPQPPTVHSGTTSLSMADDDDDADVSIRKTGLHKTISGHHHGHKSVSPTRRLSFKLRQGSTAPKPAYRTSKVTIPANSVAVLASRFNAVIIQNDAEGRALLKRLNSQQRQQRRNVTSKPVEGSVKAAIQLFESSTTTTVKGTTKATAQNNNHPQNSSSSSSSSSNNNNNNDKPKFVLMRKNSSKRLLTKKALHNHHYRASIDEQSKEERDNRSSILKKPPKPKAKPNVNHRTDLPLDLNNRHSKTSSKLSDKNENEDVANSRIDNTEVQEETDDVGVIDDSADMANDDCSTKQIWRKYTLRKDRTIDSIANDFIDNPGKQDVVKGLKDYTMGGDEGTAQADNVGKEDGSISDSNIEGKCECNTHNKDSHKNKMTRHSKEQHDHVKRCVIHYRKLRERESNSIKIKKEKFRKFLVKSEDIKAVAENLTIADKTNDTADKVGETKVILEDKGNKNKRSTSDRNNIDLNNKTEVKDKLENKDGKHEVDLINTNGAANETTKLPDNRSPLKPKISPKPNIDTIDKRPKLSVQEKRLSLAKDQSALESALNESAIITAKKEENVTPADEPEKPNIRNHNNTPMVKPNRSFLWDTLRDHSTSIKNKPLPKNTDTKSNKVKDLEKTQETMIIEGVRHNVELKIKNNSYLFRDVKNGIAKSKGDADEPIYTNGQITLTASDLSKIKSIKNTNGVLVIEKVKKADKTDEVNNREVNYRNLTNVTSSFQEDKENTIYEELENHCTNDTSTSKPALKYMNLYITEARNNEIAPIQARNEILQRNPSAAGYEKINDPAVSCTTSLHYSGSKLSYGYVRPVRKDGDGGIEVEEETYASIPEDDGDENIYDDVINQKIGSSKQESDSCHYECISDIGGVSLQDSDSSCDQINSIYGGVSHRPLSRTSSASYRATHPTHSETSDEWVDILDNSGDEEIFLYEKRNKPRVRGMGSWSQKVRRQWSAKRASTDSLDGSEFETSSHQYEAVQGLGGNQSIICDDFDGSFDSDSSFDDDPKAEAAAINENRTLPSVPQNDGIYGFMKQAGKRMRKHWSLGKSLRRIRKLSVGATLPSPTEETAGSTNGSNTSLNRRRWSSFKSKFKPQLSASAGSTFYLDNVQSDDVPNDPIYANSPDKQSVHSSPANSTQGSVTTDPRRFSVSSIRPTSPPPPPPSLQKGANNDDTPPKRPPRSSVSNTSWYSESGVYDVSANGSYSDGSSQSRTPGNSCWYSDGTWDTRQTVADAASDHSSSQGSDLHLRFADEPLYQFYNETVTKEKLHMCYSMPDSNRGSGEDFDSDGYEEIGGERFVSRPSAMDLITPKQGHHRTLWCEIPEVIQSEILKSLSKDERKLQEAKFEVMTSEASYFKSLTVLEKHFAASPLFLDESVLSAKDRKSLFGHIASVRRCSEKLLSALDQCWQESIMLSGICDIVHQHAKQHFQVYITYCSKQIDLNATLRKLKDTSKRFEEVLNQLEADPKCESLSLHSFLMLPMQRVTRMPLLIDAILSKLDTNHQEYKPCNTALRTLNEFVQKCNEETRQQERVIEMVKLSRQLEFSREIKTLPIVSKNRWLIRSGQVLYLNSETRQTFGRKFTKQGTKITLFLFNDVLLVAKRKGEESYLVLDHCQRNLIQMSEEDDVANSLRYLLKIAMLKNYEGKLVEMIVSCDTETSRQRWLQTVAPPTSENPGESIYDAWDCPQVIAIHTYKSTQPDELSIQQGDIINVLRKMVDGWYHGERTRDGEMGWFPGNHVNEIISQHIRARNLQQRYRLLMLSGSYVQQQTQQTHRRQK